MSETTYGINRTIGWSWTFRNPQFWFGIIVFFIVLFIIITIVTVVIMKLTQLIKKLFATE